MSRSHFLTGAIAIGAAGALVLSGCSADGGDAGAKGEVTIGYFNWDEAIAASELWKAVLEDEGYEVTLEMAEPAPIFQGLASGDYDFTLDVWLPFTHKPFLEQYGEDIVDLGGWHEGGFNAIAVNEDAPIDSLEELADNAELFDNRLVGIEAGAGLTQATEENVIPDYGLQSMDYVISSTPAMLTELQRATEAGDNIAVTLWSPHWAYEAFPIKNLEDPQKSLGETETIHSYGTSTFTEDFPEIAGWLGEFQMESEMLHDLENYLFNEHETDEYAPLVREWMAENQEYVDGLTG